MIPSKYKKRPLLRCIHHFQSDLINNMDSNYAHFGYLTLISDPWPNKVIQKFESDVIKLPKQAETTPDCVMNSQITIFNQFSHGQF